jgi:hypothetical protein
MSLCGKAFARQNRLNHMPSDWPVDAIHASPCCAPSLASRFGPRRMSWLCMSRGCAAPTGCPPSRRGSGEQRRPPRLQLGPPVQIRPFGVARPKDMTVCRAARNGDATRGCTRIG